MTSTHRLPRALVALFAAVLAMAGLIAVAQAAEPAEGTVSKAAPKVAWAGTLISSGISANAWNNGQTDTPCESPTCDRFTLTVSDSGPGVNLIIKTRLGNAAAQGNNGTATLRVTDPANKVTIYTGESGPETDLKTTIKNAANGVYLIDTAASFICCSPTEYSATAELAGAGFGTPTTPPPGEGGGTPPPVTGPGGGQQSTPPTTLKLTAPAASARKVKKTKKISAKLATSSPLTNVNLVLVDKKKKIGGLKISRLEGTKKVTIKLSKKAKLRKGGRYQLSAGGTDAQGRTVTATVRVAVKK